MCLFFCRKIKKTNPQKTNPDVTQQSVESMIDYFDESYIPQIIYCCNEKKMQINDSKLKSFYLSLSYKDLHKIATEYELLLRKVSKFIIQLLCSDLDNFTNFLSQKNVKLNAMNEILGILTLYPKLVVMFIESNPKHSKSIVRYMNNEHNVVIRLFEKNE